MIVILLIVVPVFRYFREWSILLSIFFTGHNLRYVWRTLLLTIQLFQYVMQPEKVHSLRKSRKELSFSTTSGISLHQSN